MAIVFCSFALLAVLTLLWSLRRQRRKYRRLEGRMQVLSTRLNPHFFSNSLNAIEGLVNLDQKREASKYLIHFSHLMRKVLLASGEEKTTLRKELAIAKHYLAMEELRFKNKMTYKIAVDAEVETALMEVPSLVFQPFLEQAINERIVQHQSQSLLSLEVKREGSYLCCIITDEVLNKEGVPAPDLQVKHRRENNRQEPRQHRWFQPEGAKIVVSDLQNKHGEAYGTHLLLRLPFKIFKP